MKTLWNLLCEPRLYFSGCCRSIQPELAASHVTFNQVVFGIVSGASWSFTRGTWTRRLDLLISDALSPGVRAGIVILWQFAGWTLLLLLLLLERWHFSQTLLQKDTSLCAPIQDNQVIVVHMPRSPALPPSLSHCPDLYLQLNLICL